MNTTLAKESPRRIILPAPKLENQGPPGDYNWTPPHQRKTTTPKKGRAELPGSEDRWL